MAGTDNDSYFDSLSVQLIESDCPSIRINEMDPNEIIKVYPNPTNGELLYETLIGYESILIFNQLGQEVFTANLFGKSGVIDISEISEGIYTITFIKENVRMSKRFIKSSL